MTLQKRVHPTARYMSESLLNKYNDTWINIIHSLLVTYTGCKRPRSGRGITSRVKAIVHNIEGIYLSEKAGDDEQPNQKTKNPSSDANQPTLSIYDMQKSIQTMAGIFTDAKRRTADAIEAFNWKLAPILRHMENIQIAPSHRFSILYSFLAVKARDACDTLYISTISLCSMLGAVKKKVLFDVEIQDRRVTRWTTAKFDNFLGGKSHTKLPRVYDRVSERSFQANAC